MCVCVSFCSKISHSYQLDRLGRRIIKASFMLPGEGFNYIKLDHQYFKKKKKEPKKMYPSIKNEIKRIH